YFLIGADANPYCPQFAKVDRAVTLPRADAPDFIDAVLAVCEQTRVRALFYGCEPELRAYSANRHRFAERDILLPLNPEPVIRIASDKAETARFLAEHGFSYPRFRRLKSAADLE